MERYLGKYSPWLYATLRIIAGVMFALHGSQKVLGWPAGQGPRPPVGSFFWIGGLIELIAGLLIAIGLFTSYAAFVASGEMAVAYFIAHHSMEKILPILNQGELAVLYCFVFLYIASRGTVACGVETAMNRSGARAYT